MLIYILPISGGGFVGQLAMMSELNEANIINKKKSIPDLSFCASGGCVTSYISLAANYTNEGILRIIEYLKQEIFIRSWWPSQMSFLPSPSLGIFSGSLYRSGEGVEDIFNTIFTPKTITQIEILTLTYNVTKNIPQVFSNISYDDSFFKYFNEKDKIRYGINDILYNNGNIEEISKTVMASSAIPLVTQKQKIDNDMYADGGIGYASSFTPLSEKLKSKLKEENIPFQMVYFCSYDMEDPSWIDSSSFKANKTFASMSHSSIIQDRALAISFIKSFANEEEDVKYLEEKDITFIELSSLLSQYQNNNYVLILYPSGSPYVNLLSFTNKDVEKEYLNAKKSLSYYFWYLI